MCILRELDAVNKHDTYNYISHNNIILNVSSDSSKDNSSLLNSISTYYSMDYFIYATKYKQKLAIMMKS